MRGGLTSSQTMGCLSCEATERHFSEALAGEDLRRYQQQGPDGTTRILLEALAHAELQNASLLDIGGGVGVILHELLGDGVTQATLVEAASSYLSVAEAETRRRGHRGRVSFVYGDFVHLAEGLPEADLVTLDRVVCCYADVERLITSSAAKCLQWYALSYPRDRWFVRVAHAFKNWRCHRAGDPFRTYVHPERRIHERLTAAGFQRRFHRGTLFWQVAVYRRAGPWATRSEKRGRH